MSHDRPVGELLRVWRHRRGLTQLDLAIQADVSTRHVSFVETGRTIPSSAMVLHLAEHLAVPLRERNRLLVAAGHAPVFRQRPLDDPDLAGARKILEQVVRGHEPYPALVVDHRWNLVLANGAMEVFLDGVDEALLRPPVNMMRLGLHPDGFAPRLLNLPQVRGFLLPRLARQVARTGDPELSALHEELLSYGPPVEMPPPNAADVALPIRIRHQGTELCFVNTITTFGTAFDITLDEIAIEAYFPADPETARHYRISENGGQIARGVPLW
ncbi:Transcriptional regulator, contains XRE-family HTH domain [Nonomuraea solani]|uniref:Transcriptional regulator, contains XRE-family HTH domain n=1 Tax=Nonomuraea solani TaxID=1144553 RepID=A0A1H5XT46_9ACTN|nr:helix-turn-helix transcriptional regulator [Nonomuraea solani]SEG14914.1 Transcriptional regulator, contains XRE-family HTH domain [Nonomuraea solani]